jgi:hypothetical protein
MTGFLDQFQSIFGPRPEGAEQKKSGSAEAGRSKGNMMLNILEKQARGNVTGIDQEQQCFPFIREGKIIFSPEDAATVLASCRYERQRDETRAKSHIASLAEQMRRGLWLPKTQIDFANVNGRKVLVNGHHRMHAQVAAGATILWNVVVHDCADDGEVAALYWKFDTTVRKRSTNNVVDGIGLADDLGIEKQWANVLWNAAQILHLGLRFHFHERDGAALLPDERVAVCRDYAAEALAYQEAAKKAILPVRTKLRKVSFFAPGLAVLRHDPATAREFIGGLCEDDGLAKGDPRKTLLADMQVRRGTSGLYSAQMMSFALAWNAYRAGRELKIIKVTGGAVRLSGTPFTVRA